MAMRRKAKRVSMSARFDHVDSRFDALESDHGAMAKRFAMVDFRLAELQAEIRAGFARMDGRFDKVMSNLDRMTGELFDNRESHTLFGAMLGEHRRTLASHDQRLTSLESRRPPPAR